MVILEGSSTVMALVLSGQGAGRYRLIINMRLPICAANNFQPFTTFMQSENSNAKDENIYL